MLTTTESTETTTNETEAPEQVLRVPRAHIRPSPLQPRTSFPEESLGELAQSLRQNGVIHPLIVRPCEPSPEYPEARYEIVDGERRWRAAASRAKAGEWEAMAEMASMPVIVHELCDLVVKLLMVGTAIQRQELTAVEESDSFCWMMGQTKENGEKEYPTVESLAIRLGLSPQYVSYRLGLAKLSPLGRSAVQAGRISFRTARIICAAPQSVVPLIEDVVLNPVKYGYTPSKGDALDSIETEDVIADRFVRHLHGAPFDPQRTDLVPELHNEQGERVEGGSCTSCPWNAANQRTEEISKKGQHRPTRQRGDGHACLNVSCFTKKVEVNLSTTLMKAAEDGAKILQGEDAARALSDGGTYVRLAEKLSPNDAAKGIAEVELPKWEKLVAGPVRPPVLVVVDPKGKVHKLVERKLAITAAQENGYERYLSLSAGRGRSKQAEDVAARAKEEQEKARLHRAQSLGVLEAVLGAFEEVFGKASALPGAVHDFASALLPVAARHAGGAGCELVAKRRGWGKLPKGEEAEELLEKAASELAINLPELVLELLLAEGFAQASTSVSSGALYPDAARSLLDHLDIAPAQIAREVKQRLAAERKHGGKKPGAGSEEVKKEEETGGRGDGETITSEAPSWPAPATPPAVEVPARELEMDEATNPHEDHLLPRVRELYASGECRSVPALQRKLPLGYQRALRLFDIVIDKKFPVPAPEEVAPVKKGTKGKKAKG